MTKPHHILSRVLSRSLPSFLFFIFFSFCLSVFLFNSPLNQISATHLYVGMGPPTGSRTACQWPNPQKILSPLVVVDCQWLLLLARRPSESCHIILEFWLSWSGVGHELWVQKHNDDVMFTRHQLTTLFPILQRLHSLCSPFPNISWVLRGEQVIQLSDEAWAPITTYSQHLNQFWVSLTTAAHHERKLL